MGKVTFVKPKKIWKKRFDKETLEKIWDAFINTSPLSKEEWQGKSAIKWIRKHNCSFCYPETDKYDDSCGFQPEQISSFLEMFNVEQLEYFFAVLNSYSTQRHPFFKPYEYTGIVSWEDFFNQIAGNLLRKAKEDNLSFDFFMGDIILSINMSSIQNLFMRSKFTGEAIEEIGRNPGLIENLMWLNDLRDLDKETKIINKEFLCKGKEMYLDMRKELWKKEAGVEPKVNAILYANPKNFSKEIIPFFGEFFGEKQLSKLSEEAQKHAATIINVFGVNALKIDKGILKSPELEGLPQNNNQNFVKDVRNVLGKVTCEYGVREVISLIDICTNSEKIKDSLEKRDEIDKEVISVIDFINEVIKQEENEDEKLKIVSFFDFRDWKILKRYMKTASLHNVKSLIQIWENRNEKSVLPMINGTSGKYEYGILPKDSKMGLLLGYATDCCQVIGNNGESCIRAGYQDPRTGFFVVTKDGKIYAQSLVWENEDYDGLKTFCFDTIEVLGLSLNKSKDVLNAYRKAIEELKKHYDRIIIGSDGNRTPEGQEKLGERIDEPNIDPPTNAYTDIYDGYVIEAYRKD